MDRLIWAAWRAFWVGLGASAVLIVQSLAVPAPAASPAPPAVDTAKAEPAAPVVAHEKPPARAPRTSLKRYADPS